METYSNYIITASRLPISTLTDLVSETKGEKHAWVTAEHQAEALKFSYCGTRSFEFHLELEEWSWALMYIQVIHSTVTVNMYVCDSCRPNSFWLTLVLAKRTVGGAEQSPSTAHRKCMFMRVTFPCHHTSVYTSIFLTTFTPTDQIMSKVSYWLEPDGQLHYLAACLRKGFAIFV